MKLILRNVGAKMMFLATRCVQFRVILNAAYAAAAYAAAAYAVITRQVGIATAGKIKHWIPRLRSYDLAGYDKVGKRGG